MADVIVANTSPGIAGKTLACHDADGVTTGIWGFVSQIALRAGLAGVQTWRVSVNGSGNLVIAADGSGAGLAIDTAGGLYEKTRTTPLGHWADVPFNAANFAATGGGTWTVGSAAIVTNRYTLIGKTLLWSLYVSWFSGGNVLAGTVTGATLTLPAGLINPVPSANGVAIVYEGAAQIEGVRATYNGNLVSLAKVTGAPFVAGPLGLITMFMCEVQ